MVELSLFNLAVSLITVVVGYLLYSFLFPKPVKQQEKKEQVEEEDTSKQKLLIIYGSQTGTAEDYSNTLAQDAKRYGFRPKVMDMVDVNGDDLAQEELVIFVVATYGEGEPTDNTRDFFEWLMEPSREKEFFKNLKFSVFGLGNKQYKIYQKIGRSFDKRFEELGAQRIFPRGEGDADGTLEEDFEDWKTQILNSLSNKYNTEISEEKIEKKCELKFFEGLQLKNSPRRSFYDAKTPFKSTVMVNKELIKSKERSTVHVEFDIKGTSIIYEAGDHLAVLPENDQNLINAYAKRLGCEDKLETVFSLISKEKKTNYFPKKCTLNTGFKLYLALAAVAKKKFLKGLALYASDEKEKNELTFLSSNTEDGRKAYNSKIKDPAMTSLDVMNQYKSTNIPLDLFLELMPRLQPRYYSIASSSQMHPDSIHIVVAVVTYKSTTDKVVKGICSNFLKELKEGSKSYIFVRRSTFHLPDDTKKPLILIGPGTGAAPMIGFLQQRLAQKAKGKELGKCTFYFGCRNAKEDFIYEDLMKKAEKEGVISLKVAFSRDQEKKVYVQHKLQEDAKSVWEVLSNGGSVYVCGDAKYMAKDVDKTLLSIAKEFLGSEEKAFELIENLSKENRYLKDVWSP